VRCEDGRNNHPQHEGKADRIAKSTVNPPPPFGRRCGSCDFDCDRREDDPFFKENHVQGPYWLSGGLGCLPVATR